MRRNKAVKVLICNRHQLFREGIKALLAHNSFIKIVGEAASTEEALRILQRSHPDVVLLDTAMQDSTGPEATRRIKAKDPHTEVLIVSLNDDEPLISRCLEAGAAGCIHKDDRPIRLKSAIHTALRGHVHAA